MSNCVRCGGPGIRRVTSVDDIDTCQDCEAAMAVARALDRQFEEMFLFPGETVTSTVPLGPNDETLGRSRAERRRYEEKAAAYCNGEVSEAELRQLDAIEARAVAAAILALEEDGEFGRTR